MGETWNTRATLTLIALLASAVPSGAVAHEVLHEVVHDRAVAVRVYEPGGHAFADAEFEVFSPAGGSAPYLRGRTDRGGWLAFVPDEPGAWRVRVSDASGHGLATAIDVPAAGAPAPGAGPAAGPASFTLRPLLGAAVIAAIFTALVVAARRRRPAKR